MRSGILEERAKMSERTLTCGLVAEYRRVRPPARREGTGERVPRLRDDVRARRKRRNMCSAA